MLLLPVQANYFATALHAWLLAMSPHPGHGRDIGARAHTMVITV